jgi:carboxymethylenebutenolidase
MSNRLRPLLAAALTIAVAATGSIASRSSGPPRADIEMVHLGPGSGGTEAFVAWPTPRANAPAVIVVHEAWGLNGQIRDMARRLSREGYVAIVPDLYHGRMATDLEKARQLARALDRDAALADLRAALAWLRARPETSKSRIAAMGFDIGARLAQELGLDGSDLAAVVMFYGMPETDVERLKALPAPIQAHFGADDDGLPPWHAEKLRDALARAGKAGEVFVYPGAGHAFMNENRSSYRPDAARQAWARTLAFLQKPLKS